MRTRWHERDAAPMLLGAAWVITMAGALLALRLGVVDRGPPCPLRTLTGVACPSCGATRAAGWLVRGEIGRALATNPLATLLMLGTPVLVAAWWWLGRTRPRTLPWGWVAGGIVALVAANWVYVLWHGV